MMEGLKNIKKKIDPPINNKKNEIYYTNQEDKKDRKTSRESELSRPNGKPKEQQRVYSNSKSIRSNL